MRFFRRKNGEPKEENLLTIAGTDGENWVEFPAPVVDAVRRSITRILRTDSFPERLVVTSAVREEGVTYISRAIGAMMARDFNKKCCIVELNWWWPAEYPDALEDRLGIADVLEEEISLEEAFVPTGMDNLTLLPAGHMANNRRSFYAGSEALSTLLDTISTQFDHIILDIPAVTATSNSILLAGLGTHLCFVIQQGVTPVQRIKAALDDLDHLNIIGVILNQVKVSTPGFLLNYIAQE